MGERATTIFPYAIAVALPPAGLVLAAAALFDGDRYRGSLLFAIAVVAALVWVLALSL